jgi:pilus assembly protein CpaB
MKQKNLVMLGVAVGCGLVAAIAVAKLSSVSAKGPETTKVLVAKKDLPVQTKLDSKELDNLLTWVDMPRNLVPPDAVTSLEDVKDKELNRTLKTGNPVAYSDLGLIEGIKLPDGHKQITFRSSQVDAVAGFVRPGSKVDVMYVERTSSGKARAGIILKDMLVLAVNMVDRLKDGQGPAIPQVESVSLAVTDKQARILALAEDKGKLKLVLRGNDSKKSTTTATEETGGSDIEWLEDPFDNSKREAPPVVVKQPEVKLDTAVVARKPVPKNTLINADNVHNYFETIRVENTPQGVIQNPDDLKGKYVIKALDEGQYLYKALTANEPTDVKTPEPVAPVGPAAPPPVPTAIKEHNRRLPRFEQTISEGGRFKRVIWMKIGEPDKWKRFESEREADEYRPEPEPGKQ